MSVASQANDRLGQLVSLATKIEAHLAGKGKGKGKGNAETAKGGGNDEQVKKDAAVVSGLSSSMTELIKVAQDLDPKAGNNLSKFLQNLADSIKKATESGLDPDKVKELMETVEVLSDGAGKFMRRMASGIIWGIPAMLGSFFFGTTVKILMGVLKNVATMSEDQRESVRTIIELGGGALKFGLVMSAWLILGIPALLGATLFATTVLVVVKILNKIAGTKKETLDTVQTLLSMAKGAALFALVMVGISFMVSEFAIGVLAFTLGVTVMLGAFRLVTLGIKPGMMNPIRQLLNLAKGAALFSLVMVGIGFLAPQFFTGVLVFTLGVSAMLLVFRAIQLIPGMNNPLFGPVAQLLKLARGAAMFALVMVGIGFLAQPFAIGVLVFTLAVSAMLIVFGVLTAAFPGIKAGAMAIRNITAPSLMFTASMILIGFFAKEFAIGVLVFTLATSVMLITFGLLASAFPMVKVAGRALNQIMKPSFMFALTMIGIGFFAQEFAIGVLTFTLATSVMLIAYGLIGKAFPQINRAARALQQITKPSLLFALMVVAVGFFAEEAIKGSLVLAAGMLAVGGAAYLVGKMDKKGEVTRGGIVLGELAIPMIAFAAAMFILASAPGTAEDLFIKLGAVAASIVGLGLAAYALGLPMVFPFVELGAGALITLGAALLVFSVAIFILSKAELDKKKSDDFGYAIKTLGEAVAYLGLMSIPALLGVAVLIPISLALLPITGSLALFKSIGWEKKDGESLKNAINSTVKAFAHALDGIGLIGMIKLLAAIPIIAMIGLALVALAAGVKAMATLSFTEMEYDEKEKKLIPRREVKLTNEEIQAVGPNVASILNALAMPLTVFGMWASMGAEPGFLGIGGKASYMEQGIEQASKIGRILTTMAEGVANMANLQVVDYEIVNKGTPDAKLVPVRTRQLTPVDFALAGINVSTILSVLAEPLTKFGMWADAGSTEGFFGLGADPGYMSKGIDMAAKVSQMLGTLAEGVHKMASLEVVENVIVGQGTKDAKLVPGNVRVLKPDDFTTAAFNTGQILSALITPLTDFGKAMEEGETWFGFGKGYIEKGIEWSAKAVDPVVKVADLVLKMAGGQAVMQEVVDDGKGGKKLQPGKVINFLDQLPDARRNIEDLLRSFTGAIIDWSYQIDANEEELDTALSFMPDLVKMTGDVGKVSDNFIKVAKNYAEVLDIEAKNKFTIASKNLEIATLLVMMSAYGAAINEENMDKYEDTTKTLVRASKNVSDIAKEYLIVKNTGVSPEKGILNTAAAIVQLSHSFTKMDERRIDLYYKFTAITTHLTKIITPFEKFTRLFGEFTKQMGIFVKDWEMFGKDNSDYFKQYADSLKVISTVDAGKLRETTAALKEQAQATADLNRQTQQSQINQPNVLQTGIDKVANTVGNMFKGGTTGPSTTPTQHKPQETKFPQVISELKVTNLYVQYEK